MAFWREARSYGIVRERGLEAWARSGGRVGLLVAGALALAACASPPPPDDSPSYDQQISRWSGETEADLVTAWGVPAKTHVLADGGRIIEYNQAGEAEKTCTTRFTLDESGRIKRWWYRGAECRPPSSG